MFKDGAFGRGLQHMDADLISGLLGGGGNHRKWGHFGGSGYLGGVLRRGDFVFSPFLSFSLCFLAAVS